jgi:hypothetical protein
MNKVIYIVFIIIFVAFSCKKKSNPNIADSYIRQLSEWDDQAPSIHSFDLLFVSTDSNQIAETNIGTLHHIFEKKFSENYDTFNAFLNASLNNNLIIPRQILIHGQVKFFTLDNTVSLSYRKGSLKLFLNKYCLPNNSGGYQLNELARSSGAIKSILYYLFINNFKIKLLDSPESFSIVVITDKD